MAIALERIASVLNRPGFEGPQQLRGYIPCNLTTGGTANYYGGDHPERHVPMGISGVTVATGVDLGQTDAATLTRLGVSASLVDRLRPYLERRKADAVRALHDAPLTLWAEEADSLDTAMLGHHVSMISRRYDRDAGAGAFEALPWQAQSVVVSLLYQRGVNSPSRFPHTWASLVRGDWADAAARLSNGALWEGYQHRRSLEGRLLRELC